MKKVFFVLFLSLLYACGGGGGGGGGGNTSSHYWTQFEADDFLVVSEVGSPNPGNNPMIVWSHDNRGQAPDTEGTNDWYSVYKILSDEDFCAALHSFNWSFFEDPCNSSSQVVFKGFRYPFISCSWLGGFDSSFWGPAWDSIEDMLNPAYPANLPTSYCDFYRIDSGAYYYGGWQNAEGEGGGTAGCQVSEAGGALMFTDDFRPGDDAWVMNWTEEDFPGVDSSCGDDGAVAVTLTGEEDFKWFTNSGSSFGSIQILEVDFAAFVGGSFQGADCLTFTREYGFIDFSMVTGCASSN